MKNHILFALATLPAFAFTFATRYNPVLPVYKGKKIVEGYEVHTYYFPLEAGISQVLKTGKYDKGNDVKQRLEAALTLKSDSLTAVNAQGLKYTAVYLPVPQATLLIRDVSTGERISYPVLPNQAVSANRAIEIVQNGSKEKKLKMENGRFYFGSRQTPVIENATLQTAFIRGSAILEAKQRGDGRTSR